jgi:hypothetical protein
MKRNEMMILHYLQISPIFCSNGQGLVKQLKLFLNFFI